jgi:hypothetical protein
MLKPKIVRNDAQSIPPLWENPEYIAALDDRDALRARAEQTEQRRQRALARKKGLASKRPLSDRATDLLFGGSIPAGNPEDELGACDAEDEIIYPVLAEAQAKLDDLAGKLSFEMCQRLRSRHDDCLRAALQAMTELHGAISDAMALQAELRGAGYHPTSYALPLPIPHAAAILGDPGNFSSPAAAFKRQLENMGVL